LDFESYVDLYFIFAIVFIDIPNASSTEIKALVKIWINKYIKFKVYKILY